MIDRQKKRQLLLKSALQGHGFNLLQVDDTSERLVAQSKQLRPDIIVMGVNTLNVETLEQLLSLKKNCPTPVIIFAEKETPDVVRHSLELGVSAYIIDDITPHRIASIIRVGHARFTQQQCLEAELRKAKIDLSNRKVIDRAKGVLMQQKNLSENQAFQIMRKMSMNKGLPIASIAINIIDVLELAEA